MISRVREDGQIVQCPFSDIQNTAVGQEEERAEE